MPRVAETDLVSSAPDFQHALRSWYRKHARPLPWRQEPSLYRTVVSEFMLQQTQVKTMLPYFDRWLRELPDFAAVAAAPEDRILRLWEGLGYYTRARNLRKLAAALAGLPAPPRTPEAWRELPGVGPYTAAAITSIAFGAPAACVDGNVVRILARLTGDGTAYRDSAHAAKAFSPVAHALLPAAHPGDHNQAMMELGATVCLRRKPLCLTCPVRAFCAAGRSGEPESFPRLSPKLIEQRTVTRLWCERHGELLLHRSPASARRFANIHELPSAASLGLTEAAATTGPLLATQRRGITRFQITENIHRASASAVRDAAGPDLVWVPLADLETVTLSGPHRRWIRQLLADRA